MVMMREIMCVSMVTSRCSRWWSFNVETNSTNAASDGEAKSEATEDATADSVTDTLKTQLAETEVQFAFLIVYFLCTLSLYYLHLVLLLTIAWH